MKRIDDASSENLHPFVKDSIEPGSMLCTDGWNGYSGLEEAGYVHEATLLRGRKATEYLPRVHRFVSLLKRWLMGTHQGSVSHEHLDYYLDEFTFRFNRRTSRHRGKLFTDFYNILWKQNLFRTMILLSKSEAQNQRFTKYSGDIIKADTPIIFFDFLGNLWAKG